MLARFSHPIMRNQRFEMRRFLTGGAEMILVTCS
jgi:hypothetical protein